VKVRFKYIDKDPYNRADASKTIEGTVRVTVVPETEAEYMGGNKQITEYFNQNVVNKISEKNPEKIQQAVLKFTVDEDGQIINPKITRTSNDSEIDKLLLDAAAKMPKWKPAQNAQGTKVKQDFTIPFGNGGC
jgi:TonB family protein